MAGQPTEHFAGTLDFAYALLLLAEACGTMRHIRGHIQVRWYPPRSYVVEQGEAAAELFLILSGKAEVWQESNNGHREQLSRLGVGEFFGELGIARNRRRNADVIAVASLTGLVLSPASPTKFACRGRGARLAGALPGARANPPLRPETYGEVRASSPATCPTRSCVRSQPFPPTAASSRWNRTCSRSSCYRRCSAANISWPPLLIGLLSWTRCLRGPVLDPALSASPPAQ